MSQIPLNKQLTKIRREAEERDAQRSAKKFNIPYLNLTKSPIQIDSLRLIEEEKARELQVAPFQYRNRVLALAAVNPETDGVKEFIKQLETKGNKIKLFVASLSSLRYAWSYYKFVIKTGPDISGKVIINKERFHILFKKLNTIDLVKKEIATFDFKTMPTTNLIEIIIAGALKNRASDVHLEAEEKGARFRFRIDGALHDVVPNFPKDVYPFLVSRIKLLSNLKLNVKDVPQDGRFSIELEKKEIEMRVSLIPSEFGERL